ncbi:MAG TPA: cytochrome C [Desulfuromonadales bacterium]|nr:cytochrome C [Desulfuromonadales bacterium]
MKKSFFITIIGAISISATAHAAEINGDLGNVIGGNAIKAHGIIEKKCTACHSKDKIDVALSTGKDMNEIQKNMEKKGVKLNSNESEVLGIFWKQSKPTVKK